MKCEFCESTISAKDCLFARTRKTTDGKEHVFCCERCADRYGKKPVEAK